MKLFLYEYLSSGACSDIPLDSSLMREGVAMMDAMVRSLSAESSFQLAVMRDQRLPDIDCASSRVIRIESADHERRAYAEELGQAEMALIVAPETGDVLAKRVQQAATRLGSEKLWNCEPSVIDLCGDKYRFSQFALTTGVPIPPTRRLGESVEDWSGDLLVKPRDGAGCESTYRFDVTSYFEWYSVREADDFSQWIVQPYLNGISLSSAIVLNSSVGQPAYLPLGKQEIQGESKLHYQGGAIPWRDSAFEEVTRRSRRIVDQICRDMPGMKGYVGFDWLWCPEEDQIYLVEINPRMTTSVVGYESLFPGILGSLMADGQGLSLLDVSKDHEVRFLAEGNFV